MFGFKFKMKTLFSKLKTILTKGTYSTRLVYNLNVYESYETIYLYSEYTLSNIVRIQIRKTFTVST